MPIVNLNALYEKIGNNSLITNDGVKRWSESNFLSANRNFLSAFGETVIPNELIKTINTFYKTDIPLIATRGFLK